MNSKRSLFITAALLASVSLAVATASAAELAILLEGATVHPVSGPALDGAVVGIDDQGEIVYVGPPISTGDDVRRIDLEGLHLYPGLIAASSSLGLTEISAVPETNDTQEIGDHNARLHAYRSINPDSELIPVARANGITHALVIPGGGLVRGHSGLMALEGWTWEQRLVLGPAGLHLNWPSMRLLRGADAKPLKEQIEAREKRISALSDRVEDARAYAKARRANGSKGAEHVPRDLELEAWQSVMSGEIPLMVHADDPRQIEAAIDWCDERDLRLVIVGGREAHLVADRLAAAEVPVILTRVMARPTRDWDATDSGYRRASMLHEAGVELAISLPDGAFNDSNARNLAFHAGMARAHGLPNEVALASVTAAAARILGVADRMGTIEVGKRAHLIATTGDILDIRTRVTDMWIDGQPIDLQSRHTRLNERYRARLGESNH